MTNRLQLRDYLAWGYLLAIVTFMASVQMTPSIIQAGSESAGVEFQNPRSSPDGASSSSRIGIESKTGSRAIGTIADHGMASMLVKRESNSFIPLGSSFAEGDAYEGALANATDGSVIVRKVIKAGPRELGEIDITIDRESRLLMDIGDARKLLDRDPQALRKLLTLPASGLTSFAAMREKGIDFRYDPGRDQITLEVR